MTTSSKNRLPPKDITAEGSVREIWRAAKKLPEPLSNKVALSVALLVLILYAMLSDQDASHFASQTRNLSEAGFRFSTIVLGFLMAGMSMFSGLVRSDYAKDLSRIENEDYGLSFLKVMLLSLMKPFLYFLFAAFLFFGMSVVAQSDGPGVEFMIAIKADGWQKDIASRASFTIVAGLHVLLLLALKSFVFNIYKSITAAVRYEVETSENKS